MTALQAGAHEPVNQAVRTEQIDASAQQVAHSWLRHAQERGGLGLGEAS